MHLQKNKHCMSENPPLTREEVDIFCDASEDYEENKEQCDKLYDMVKDDDEDDDEDQVMNYSLNLFSSIVILL